MSSVFASRGCALGILLKNSVEEKPWNSKYIAFLDAYRQLVRGRGAGEGLYVRGTLWAAFPACTGLQVELARSHHVVLSCNTAQ